MLATAQRLNGFTESVIREMTRVARQHGAINLSQDFPDFDPPAALLAAGASEMAKGDHHQYAITWGAPAFRQALAEKQSRLMGLEIDPDAHLVAIMTVCNPRDPVVIFSPFYENYGTDTILAGARPIYVPLHPPGFGFDREELRHAFAQRPRAIIVCNPSNPCGKVFTEDELAFIGELAREHDAFLITDEVYEHIVYAPHRHVYAAALPGLWERTLTVGSLSKTYAITGWRLGYVMAPPAIIAQARKVHDFLTVGAPHPLQEAAVTALCFPPEYYAQLTAAYTSRRDVFLDYLRHFRRQDVVLFGVRSGEGEELQRLDELQSVGIGFVALEDGRTLGMEWVGRALADSYEKQPELDGFWIHLDADVLDPSIMPAVDCPEPGGLTADELATLLGRLVRSPRFAGMDVTILDPDLDPDGGSRRVLTDILTRALTTSREASRP